jgi:hypothetical protein
MAAGFDHTGSQAGRAPPGSPERAADRVRTVAELLVTG